MQTQMLPNGILPVNHPELNARIERVKATTEPFTRERNKALASIKWRLRYGLLYAGLRGLRSVFVPKDDALVFDARDNESIKVWTYNRDLNCKFEIELL